MSDHPRVLNKEDKVDFTEEEIKYLNALDAAEPQPLTREQSELLRPLVKAGVSRALWNVLAALVSIGGLAVGLYHGKESTIGFWGELAFISGFGIWYLFGREPTAKAGSRPQVWKKKR